MLDKPSGSAKPTKWQLPSAEQVAEDIRYFWERPLDQAVFVLIFKIHNPSKHKTKLLLQAIFVVTDLIAAILNRWREEPKDDAKEEKDNSNDATKQGKNDTPNHGAVAILYQNQENGIFGRLRSRVIADTMQYLFTREITKAREIVHERIIIGACRDTAQMVVSWAENITSKLLKGKPKGTSLNEQEFRQSWVNLVAEHSRAMEFVVSLGYDPEKPPKDKDDRLIRRRKREARHMLSRLQPLDELEKILSAIEHCLSTVPLENQEGEMYVDVPWARSPKHQRGVRENWLFRRIASSTNVVGVLGELEINELVALRDELQEVKLFIERASEMLDNQEAAIQKKGKSSLKKPQEEAFEVQVKRVRAVLEQFLFQKPDAFPSVEPVKNGGELIRLFTDVDYMRMNNQKRPSLDTRPLRRRSHSALPTFLLLPRPENSPDQPHFTKAQLQYQRRLRWFQLKTERKDDAERFESEKRESEEVQGMFAALRATRLPNVQPLNFIGSMKPVNYSLGKRQAGLYRDGALLYEEFVEDGQKTIRFIYAAALLPKKQLEHTHAERANQARRQKQHNWYAERRADNPLRYAAYPLTELYAPDNFQYTLFRLECGKNYERRLRQILEQQRQAQGEATKRVNEQRTAQVKKARSRNSKPLPPGKCLPEHNPFPSAKIKLVWNKRGLPEFYLHQRVVVEPEKQQLPTRVIAFTPYEDRYAGAVLNLDGSVVWCGDLPVPHDLDPRLGARPFSDNYLFWLANTMIAYSKERYAWIGIEDTSWQKRRPTTSRETNQQIFRVPTMKVIARVEHKARQNGLLLPRRIQDVSPAYDCAACQQRLDKGEKTIVLAHHCICPSCSENQIAQPSNSKQICLFCGAEWHVDVKVVPLEQFFVCRRCNVPPRLARHNRAIVVGQKMLIDIVAHATNARKKAERDNAARDQK